MISAFTSRIAGGMAQSPTPDAETARSARILRTVLSASIALSVIMAAAVLVFIPSPLESLLVIALLILWELSTLVLTLRGLVRAASVLLTLGLCADALINSALFGGVRQIAFSTYVIVILTGGILLGKRAAAVLAAVGILGGLAILYAEMTGALPPFDPLDAPTTWAASSAEFI